VAAIENAGQVEIDHISPVLQCQVLDSAKDTGAGVVNQDIQTSKSGIYRLEEPGHLIAVGHIGGMTEYISTCRLL
jgi:hypothetical protein